MRHPRSLRLRATRSRRDRSCRMSPSGTVVPAHAPCWHPSRMPNTMRMVSGRIAPLNHRLMAVKPPAWSVNHPDSVHPGSLQIFRVIFNPRFAKHLNQFLAKRLHAMMLLLIGNVMLHRLPGCRADGKCRISFLSREGGHTYLLMHPNGGCFLQLPHHVRETMRRLEAHQQMHMVCHTAHALRESSEAANRAAEIIVEARPPGRFNEWLAAFRSENEVVMQAQVGG